MSNSYEIEIGGLQYFKKQITLFNPIEVQNNYEISGSIPEISELDITKPEWEVYKQLILAFGVDTLEDDEIKAFYLSSYSDVIQNFIVAGSSSAFLRPYAVLGSRAGSTITGADTFKQSPFYQIVDVQEIKEKANNFFSSNPCFLTNISTNQTIEPLKLAMVKSNFELLCRTIISTIKMQNIFLSSVFDNKEFYKSNDGYTDSTLIDYCYEMFKQKLEIIVPKYKKNIKVFIFEELKTKLDSGEEIKNLITNEKIDFSTPLTQENYEENIDKYLKCLFINEFIFISEKNNLLFNLSATDPSNLNDYSLAPSSSFGQAKLLTAKEYFVDSLYITGIEPDMEGSGISDDELTFLDENDYKFFAELSVQKSPDLSTITTFFTIYNRLRRTVVQLCKTSITTAVAEDIDGEELVSFMKQQLTQLKMQILNDDKFLIVTNYLFPVNKILNIASLFYINMSLKLYENLNKISDGSIKAISTIHDMILDNNTECETPTPTDPKIDDMILGVNLEILKAIATAPVQILKGIEETYDPNIFIASKIRSFAESLGAPKLPIIPYSLGLLPVLTIPPPFGIGPPLIPPWGYIYWGVDASEVILSYAKDGFRTGDIKPLFEDISKDPFKPDC